MLGALQRHVSGLVMAPHCWCRQPSSQITSTAHQSLDQQGSVWMPTHHATRWRPAPRCNRTPVGSPQVPLAQPTGALDRGRPPSPPSGAACSRTTAHGTQCTMSAVGTVWQQPTAECPLGCHTATKPLRLRPTSLFHSWLPGRRHRASTASTARARELRSSRQEGAREAKADILGAKRGLHHASTRYRACTSSPAVAAVQCGAKSMTI